jgi:hypothetical protein
MRFMLVISLMKKARKLALLLCLKTFSYKNKQEPHSFQILKINTHVISLMKKARKSALLLTQKMFNWRIKPVYQQSSSHTACMPVILLMIMEMKSVLL